MKGIESIIAIILILMIVIALAALAYTWFSGVFANLTNTASNATMTTASAMQANFVIENARNSSTTVYFSIRNIGTATIDLTKVTAYVDDVPYTLGGGCTGTLKYGEHTASECSISGVSNPKGKILKLAIAQGLEQRAVIVG